MISFIEKLLKLNDKDPTDPNVRQTYGVFTSGVGIGLNILLFFGKLIVGTLSHSISITADAYNNLSDASSSIITMIGFKMSNEKPDKDHPFGHGRIEYVSGAIVSFLILLVGFELVKSSFLKILNPVELEVTTFTIIILVISILVKLYMTFYNTRIAKKIDSTAMRATALDSRNDAITTTFVLLTSIISLFCKFNIDGYVGLLVGLFIIYSGFQAAKDTINPLLGEPPTLEFVEQIRETVVSHKDIIGVHDIIVHNYGPGRVILSLHAEVPYDCDILEIHDTIDNIEKELGQKFNCHATIHMDPFKTDDPLTTSLQKFAIGILRKHFENVTLHDFRIVPGPTHTNILFDIVIPFNYSISDEEIIETIRSDFKKQDPTYEVIIEIDKEFV